MLRDAFDGDAIIEQLVAWEDDVQMGTMSWQAFCVHARDLIDGQA